MLYIEKSNPPELLMKWKKENSSSPNCSYDDLPAAVKADLKNILLSEQGCICCYTGLKISKENHHVEHLIPQSTSISEKNLEETTDYKNMVACDNAQKYGARYKDQWPSTDEKYLFLKPTDPGCRTRMKYMENGRVSAFSPDDSAAWKTIEKLNLNHEILIKRLRNAFLNLFHTGSKQIDRTYIRKRIAKLLEKDCDEYEEFFFVKIKYLEKKLK